MTERHISDDEIYQHLRQRTSDSFVHPHVRHCESCMERVKHKERLFSFLMSEGRLSPETDLWSKIEVRHKIRIQDKKTQRMTLSFVSVAASMLLVIAFQWISLSQDKDLSNQIQAAIIQSQNLERQLVLSHRNIPASVVKSDKVSQLLLEVDLELQAAYQEHHSQSEILMLWKKRIKILKESNTELSTLRNVEVI